MTMDRAQRRALQRAEKKGQQPTEEKAACALYSGQSTWWLSIFLALPLVAVPLFFVYLLPGTLIPGSYGQILVNEYLKYVAALVCLGCLLLVAGGYFFWVNRWPRFPRLVLWPVALYLIGVGLSLTQARDIEYGLLTGLQVYLVPLLFALILGSLRWSTGGLRLFYAIVAVAALLFSIVGLAQAFNLSKFAQILPHAGAGSLLYTKNLAGEYLAVVIPLLAGGLFAARHPLWRGVLCVVIVTLLVHLGLTESRGGWVGLLAALVVTSYCLWLAFRHHRSEGASTINARHFIPAVVVAVVLFAVLGAQFVSYGEGAPKSLKSFQSWVTQTASGRIEMWSDCGQLLADKGWMGVGPGHYKLENIAYLDETYTRVNRGNMPTIVKWKEKSGGFIYPLRPHNDYLQNWAEIGLVGFLGTLWLFGSVVLVATRAMATAIERGDRERLLLIAGAFCGFMAWAASMFFEFPFRMPASMLAGWAALGLTLALSWSPRSLEWKRLPAVGNGAAGLVCAVLVVSCFYFAHVQFWGDLYGNQALAAWNNGNPKQGYQWQQRANEYIPWQPSVSVTYARMHLAFGKTLDAFNGAEAVLDRHPYLLPALWIKGVAADSLGRREDSMDAFRNILALYPFLNYNENYRRAAEGLPPLQKPVKKKKKRKKKQG
ncbi:MAG: hypothetical protein C0618_05835 [Desulfuromonas sp.]|nr:MAG: hypothetical protein C0618_05835 [Desulfuromonas sp.]